MAIDVTARPRYVRQSAPRIVSRGTVSRPKPLPKWAPKKQAAPRRVRETRGLF